MITVQEIEKNVSNLSPSDFAAFRIWFDRFDAAMWDEKLEADARTGKLDKMAAKAVSDFKQGQVKEL